MPQRKPEVTRRTAAGIPYELTRKKVKRLNLHSAGVLDVQAEHNCHNDSDNSHDDNIPGEFLHKRSNAPF